MNARLGWLLVVIVTVAAFFWFDLDDYLTLEALREQLETFAAYVDAHPIPAAAAYFLVYVAATALSLPGAAVLTLVGGAVFGLLWGTLIVSFASTAGATLAFLLSRYLFRDAVERRFRHRLQAVDKGIARDGAFYLFSLRLVPVFPFVLVNLLMGMTSIRLSTYALVSQLGMLPATIVYINAGGQIAAIREPGDVLSPALLASFALLGVFPLFARAIVRRVRARRALRRFPRPRAFDRNLIVIGGGSAGLVAAYISAALKARVTLIEKHRLGGDCLYTGCVPSKALLRSAKIAQHMRTGASYGLEDVDPHVDFAAVMARVRRVIERIEPHDSIERYTGLGVECISGDATLISPYAVRVDGREMTAKAIVVATGARPFVPPIAGLETIPYLTSDTVWKLEHCPKRLLVLGGGPIGCELSQAFARLGAAVTQVEMSPRLLMREDPPVGAMVQAALERDGVRCVLGHRAVAFRRDGAGMYCTVERVQGTNDGHEEIPFDEVIVAVGRRANTQGLGLEALGVRLNESGTIETDEHLATNLPTIFACGDVAGPYEFTHMAAHQAWYAAVNGLFGGLKRFAVDYRLVPWCTFTDPEVARVGLSETEANEREIPFELTEFGIDELDRAIADDVAVGVVRVLTAPGSDRILGVCIVGAHAGDLIAEFVLAMKHGLGLNKILQTIHIYPTLAEANKYAAGTWRRAHAPARLLRLVERFHRWNRRA